MRALKIRWAEERLVRYKTLLLPDTASISIMEDAHGTELYDADLPEGMLEAAGIKISRIGERVECDFGEKNRIMEGIRRFTEGGEYRFRVKSPTLQMDYDGRMRSVK